MKRAIRFAAICMLLALAFGAGGHNAVASSASRPALQDPYAVIEAVNALRAGRGLLPYIANSALMGIAQSHAEYMASTGNVTHTGADGSRPYQRALAVGYGIEGGYPPYFFSENIQSGGSDLSPSAVVNAWTGDDPHLHTMTSDMLQEIGAGVAVNDGRVYYVIDCARPKTSGPPVNYTPGAELAFSAANEIIVPVTKSTPNANGEIIHEVQPGQTLWQLAIEYGGKIDQIRALNSLSAEYLINPGDTLLIMKVGTATPLPATATAHPSPTPTSPPTPTAIEASPTATPTMNPATPGLSFSGAEGAVGAIIAVALVAAALVAWMGRARPI